MSEDPHNSNRDPHRSHDEAEGRRSRQNTGDETGGSGADAGGPGGGGGRSPIDPEGASGSAPPPPGVMYYPATTGPTNSRGGIWRRVGAGVIGSVLLISIGLNLYLGLFFLSVTGGPWKTQYAEGDPNYNVVILPIKGVIDDQTATFVRRALGALEKDPPQALVLRVESGGGMIQPSDVIHHRLEQFQARHGVPVVASFGQVAASGGYYVAAGADRILAEPTTITGSIGVLSMAFTVEQLLAKLGVTPEVMAASGSPQKDVANNIFRAWTEQDRQAQREMIDHMHERFVHVVRQGRQHVMTDAQLETATTGETFNARQAITNQLVDGEGYLEQAVKEAASLAGAPEDVEPNVWIMQTPPTFSALGLLGFGAETGAGAPRATDGPTNGSRALPRTADQARTWLMEMTAQRLMYYTPLR